MTEAASFEELDRAIGKVLDAKTTNFFELAEMLGLDPKQDFAGADLSGVDFLRGNLSGANFAEADLRGANFAYANLQEANLTNADLGVSTSSYQVRMDKLNRAVFLARDLTRDLTRAFDRDITLSRDRTIITHARARNRDLAHVLARARNRVRALNRDIASVLDIALDRDRDITIARNIARTIDIALDIDRALDITRARILDITRASARARSRDITRTRALDSALDRVRNLASVLTFSIGGGANFYRANLTGVILDGAKVEGAIMINCTGLLSSEIVALEKRGAIFDSSPGDRSEVHVPVPR